MLSKVIRDDGSFYVLSLIRTQRHVEIGRCNYKGAIATNIALMLIRRTKHVLNESPLKIKKKVASCKLIRAVPKNVISSREPRIRLCPVDE